MIFTNFIENKYTKWYNEIISGAQKRKNLIDGENHHIIPRSIGGNNTMENIVRLTYREHFICHLLLTKMTTGIGKTKMFFAVNYMTRGTKISNRYIPSSKLVAYSRKCFQEARLGYSHTVDSKNQTSNSMKGNKNKLGIKTGIHKNKQYDKNDIALKKLKIQNAISFHESIILDEKLLLARTLLQGTMSFKAIALKLGYNHVSNFTRWFKAEANQITPRIYRKII
jgi:AraC-like DNA-binding protein